MYNDHLFIPPFGLFRYIFDTRRAYLPYLTWAVLLFAVMFWRLGEPSFWDPDEAHYAETTRELIQTGDWLVPHYNERAFFDKPVFFHLLQAVPMAVLGPSELAARLVPALAAVALVATTWWVGLALGSAEIGLVAGLLLTVSPGVFALSRYAILDTVFTALLFGGVALTAVAAFRNRPVLQYPGYVLIGLAVLLKGPLAVVLCGAAFLLAVSLSAEARVRLLQLRWISGLAITVAVAAPWFLYMFWRFRGAFVSGYFLNENVLLFARPLYGNQPEWYFYFRILAAGLLPWTGLLVGRLYDDARAIFAGRTLDTFEVALWSWTIAVVGFFSFSRFKLDHYVFPAAPALCLLCARAWADVRALSIDGINAGARLGLRLVGPTLVVVGVVGGVELNTTLDMPGAAMTVPLVLIAGGVALIGRTLRGDTTRLRVPWITVSALGFTYVGLLLWAVPALERGKVIPEVANWVALHLKADAPVGVYRLNRWNPAFRFYIERHTEVLDSIEDARQFFERSPQSFCVTTASSYEDLVANGIPLDIVYSREGMWATSGRALWRRKDPLTNFVVVKRSSGATEQPFRPPDI